MKQRTLRRIWAMYLVNHIYTGTRCFKAKRRLLRRSGHEIGADTKVVGPLFCTGKLVIGEACWIGADLKIHGNGTVIIGDRCDIGPGVTCLTGSHEIGDAQRRAGKGFNGEIRIGEGCWLGGGATVVAGAQIGSGSVIAACACVTGAIPANTLAGGVPAKTIRELAP